MMSQVVIAEVDDACPLDARLEPIAVVAVRLRPVVRTLADIRRIDRARV